MINPNICFLCWGLRPNIWKNKKIQTTNQPLGAWVPVSFVVGHEAEVAGEGRFRANALIAARLIAVVQGLASNFCS